MYLCHNWISLLILDGNKQHFYVITDNLVKCWVSYCYDGTPLVKSWDVGTSRHPKIAVYGRGPSFPYLKIFCIFPHLTHLVCLRH